MPHADVFPLTPSLITNTFQIINNMHINLEGPMMRTITTSDAPKPSGHYSQAIVHDALVYVAGQLPINPATGEVVGTNADAQTEQTLRNVEAILKASGSSLDRLLSVTIYVTGRMHWGSVDQAFARLLGDHKPARAIIPVHELKPGCLVEIQAIASVS
jgi:2-iminobutanoate/2-iminopropanoate deaminase